LACNRRFAAVQELAKSRVLTLSRLFR
jgi:hypothetical protein